MVSVIVSAACAVNRTKGPAGSGCSRSVFVSVLRPMAQFPSMKANDLLAVLLREPLAYSIVRQNGSHRFLRSDRRPPVLFSYHGGATVPPGVVRKILVQTVGLDEDQALELL